MPAFGYTCDVCLGWDLKDDEGNPVDGYWDWDNNEILITAQFGFRSPLEILLHECIERLVDYCDWELRHDQIQTFAMLLHQSLGSNDECKQLEARLRSVANDYGASAVGEGVYGVPAGNGTTEEQPKEDK